MKVNKNSKNIFYDFPVGTKVKVISEWVDGYFWWEDTGIVIKNSGKYLSIVVQLDNPRHLDGGQIQKQFNFNPCNLEKIGD